MADSQTAAATPSVPSVPPQVHSARELWPVELETPAKPEAAVEPETPEKPQWAPLPPEDMEKIAKLRHISTLWKFQPIPSEPEPAPPRRKQARSCGNMQVFGANVRGKKHIHGGSNCDDWFEIRTEEEHALAFLAVSDGAGSKKFSRIGSKVSCCAAVENLCEKFRLLFQEKPDCAAWLRTPPQEAGENPEAESLLRGVMAGAMKSAQNALYEAFETRIAKSGKAGYEAPRDLRDLSATLLLAALVPAEDGSHTVLTCQVGDGNLALFDSSAPYETALTILGSPDSGEYAGETEFLTSSSMFAGQVFEKRVQLRRLRFDTMLVMTDGVADDYFPANPEFFRLYCDLIANGILPAQKKPSVQAPKNAVLPEPLTFSEIGAEGDRSAVALNYAWLIRDTLGRSLQDLWEDPAPLEQAARLLTEYGSAAQSPEAAAEEAEAAEKLETAADRLLRWLESYVEFTSFDDRTLVIARINRGRVENGGKES